jgi:type VI secretion system Hcp family effector
MKYRLILAILICIALCAAGPALASERFCVKFEGLDGLEPVQGCESGSTWGYEYHHLISRELQGGVPGPIRHNQVIITREWDNITPQLWQQLHTGTAFQEVIIQFPSAQPGPPQHEIRLTNVYIVAIEPLIPHVREANAYGNQSRIRLSYQTLSIQYEDENPVVLQSQQGG